jgi:16S rRNA (guanine527-N7)-methyltransferase
MFAALKLPKMTEALGATGFSELCGATGIEMADIECYHALLSDWNGRMNLVGPTALDAFWRRHAWDSAQLKFSAPSARIWADVGSGAGFPGLILAILLKSTPGAKVHLIESMLKRCRFLSAVVDRLDLPAVVHHVRAEASNVKDAEVVTARACAPLDRLLEFSWPLLRYGACGLFLKGRTVDDEMAVARKNWSFNASKTQSRSDPSGIILKIEGLSRA